MAQFKVLQGKHYEGKNEDGTKKCYRKGEVVDSQSNLLLSNGRHKATHKFELVSGSVDEYDDKGHLKKQKPKKRR